MKKRVIIVGAGPIGVEAALAASARGWAVTVLERGAVGQSLLGWGPTRLFSPFAMNASARAKALLGKEAPADDALLTGPQMVERVLVPLVERGLSGSVRPSTAVLGVGRDRMTRRDRPAHPLRAERPFRVLVAGPRGEEMLEAEVVLDASGVGVPAAIGAGGVWAIGERAVRDRFVRHLGELHARGTALCDQRVLLVGHGHSAASAIAFFDRLAERSALARVTWAIRTLNRKPCVEVANDPLPERKAIVDRANALAHEPPSWLQVERRAHVEAIAPRGDGFSVTLSGDRSVEVEVVAGFTGYRPDHSFLLELPLAISPVTEGAAGVHRALANVTDCLSVPKIAQEDLQSGEPGFYLVGAKSYGGSSSFLLKNGIEQVETILELVNA